jgi:hypothetical protein
LEEVEVVESQVVRSQAASMLGLEFLVSVPTSEDRDAPDTSELDFQVVRKIPQARVFLDEFFRVVVLQWGRTALEAAAATFV